MKLQTLFNCFLWIFVAVLQLSCASHILNDSKKQDDAKSVKTIEEFDSLVKVSDIPSSGQMEVLPPPPTQDASKASASSKKKVAVTPKKAKPSISGKPKKKDGKLEATPQSEVASAAVDAGIEDRENFVGRRPVVDPFRVGEVIRLRLTYLGLPAGHLSLEVHPFKEVNGKKSYHFILRAKSSSYYSMIYSVDDWAETFVDYETLLPTTFSMHVVETGQLRESRGLYNWQTLEGTFWEKKVTKSKGVEQRKLQWTIFNDVQNPFSAIFYLRNFTLRPGKEIAFRVGDEGKNVVFKGTVIKREVLKTDIGEFKTLLIEPRIEVDGIFKQEGQIYLWVTDDERKFPIRIRGKVKLGSFNFELDSLKSHD